MKRHQFLGSLDLTMTSSLMSNYNVPTKIPGITSLHTLTQQDDLILLQLGPLLTPAECDDIVAHLENANFETMSSKYDKKMRNSERLIVLDDRLGRMLWRRLKFSHEISKKIVNPRPLGFNVQGKWKFSGVNPAMRINRYHSKDYFAPHKDVQFAPTGDERSSLSLIIYLTDDYEGGETKFYFPKVQPQIDVKGLSIGEEIDAYQGLDHGYECISIKPRRGYAVLFTHNLLHEAVSPMITPSTDRSGQRIVLRTDVLVQRQNKPLGFAVCDDEREDYLACLNYFREAQQRELNRIVDKNELGEIGQLYERSLSIRYCYPRLLEKKLARKKRNVNETELPIDRLPTEMWLHIWKYLHEKDVENFIFAYPKFQSLKLPWQMREMQLIETDPLKPKFIPTIHMRYGCQTIFRFSDVEFFSAHIESCLRVAAVHAFFLLGNGEDATHYVVRFNRSTQEICEVEMEKLFSDVFYNRHCHGSLYRVHQQNEKRRQPTVDLHHSVDRTHMINRNQTEFIGTDIGSQFHISFDVKRRKRTDSQSDDDDDDDNIYDDYNRLPTDGRIIEEDLKELARKNPRAVLVDGSDGSRPRHHQRDSRTSYMNELFEKEHKASGSSAARMIVTNDETIGSYCFCFRSLTCNHSAIRNHTCTYNHLIFNFDTHRMTVEKTFEGDISKFHYSGIMARVINELQRTMESNISQVSHYRVNIEELANNTQGFNHASCNCSAPDVTTDQFSFLDYTYLTHVDLVVIHHEDYVTVATFYGGIAAM